MQHAQRWPIDYDALEKGSIIPVQRLEEITGKKYGTDGYSLALLKMKCQIQDELALRGCICSVRTEKGSIKVLTDAEAISYTNAGQVRGRKIQMRQFANEQAIDTSALTDDQRKQHDRYLVVNGLFMQHQAAARKELKLKPVQRAVPGLPPAQTNAGSGQAG